jgi:hypothetical protein
MEKVADKAGPAIAQRMRHWLQDADFAGVRDAVALGRLPEAERADWRRLWQDAEALRQRAAQRSAPASSARPWDLALRAGRIDDLLKRSGEGVPKGFRGRQATGRGVAMDEMRRGAGGLLRISPP